MGSKIIENYSILALIDTVGGSSGCVTDDDFSVLQDIAVDTHRFDNADRCIDFLTDDTDREVFLILSCSLSRQIVPCIHDVPQLKNIFLIADKRDDWTINWSKIRGIHKTIRFLCEDLLQSAGLCNKDNMPFSFLTVSQDVINISDDQFEPSFLHTTVCKNCFFKMEYNEISQQHFIEYCREKLPKTDAVRKLIDKFQ